MVYAALLQTLTIAIVALDNHVFKSSGSTYTEYPGLGLAKDIAIDRTGKTWILNSSDGQILYNSGLAWIALPGGGKQIAVDRCGTPFHLGTTNLIFKWTGFSWYQIPGNGRALDISVDGNDRIWIVGEEYKVWYNTSGSYVGYGNINTAKKIAASADGTPYIIGVDGRAKKGNGTGFTDLGISGKDIAVSSFGTVWVIDSNDDPYFMKNGNWYKHPDSKKALAISAA